MVRHFGPLICESWYLSKLIPASYSFPIHLPCIKHPPAISSVLFLQDSNRTLPESLMIIFVFRVWPVYSAAESTLWWDLCEPMHFILFTAAVFIWRLTKLTVGLIKPVLGFLEYPYMWYSAAMSAGPLMIESTAEGFKLYCSLKYYVNQLKTSWLFRWVEI